MRPPRAARGRHLEAGWLAVDNVGGGPGGGACRIVAADSGRLLLSIPLPALGRVAWSDDGRTLATACDDTRVHLWDAATGAPRAGLEGHKGMGPVAAFHPAGTLLASNGWGGDLRLWDPVLGRAWLRLRSWQAPGFGRDGRLFLAPDDRWAEYESEPALEYRSLAVMPATPPNCGALSVRRDGRLLAVGTDRGVVLWDLASGAELAVLPIGNAWHLAFEASGDLLTNGDAGVLRKADRRPSARKHPRGRLRPAPEALEARALLSTIPVHNLNDGGAGSLRAAIAQADAGAGGDTIAFDPGLRGTIALSSDELFISKSVTITGPGAGELAVSGSGARRVFEVAAGQDVTISGLTITGGAAADQGGGILNDGSNLTLSGDDIVGNVVHEGAGDDAEGGGVQSLGGTLTITDSQITGNRALGASGTSAFGDAHGGGVYVAAGSAAITDSTIGGNLARGGDGSGDGLAGGGGIFSAAATDSLTGVTLAGNLARGGDGAPNSGAYGGGLWLDPATATITGSTFRGNQAIGGDGGTGPFVGIAQGGAVESYSTLTVSGSTFDGNQALGGSGGNSGLSNAGPYVDYAFGGAIANTQSTVRITGSDFRRNEAVGGDGGTVNDPTDLAAVGGAEGGALYTELGAVGTVTGCTFDRNQAQGGDGNTGTGAVVIVGEALGGAIVSGFGGSLYGPNQLTVTDSTLTRNTSQGGDNNAGTAGVSGLVGVGAGAGIADVFDAETTVEDTAIAFNAAIGGGAGAGLGGGAYNDASSTLALSGTVVILNQAVGPTGIGGGVYTLGTYTADGSTVVKHNHASTSGDDVGP